MTTLLTRPELARPVRLPFLVHLGPQWFGTAMGTGIVATAAVSLPIQVRGLHVFAVCVWVLVAVLLVALTALTAAHWAAHPEQARAHLSDRVIAHFYGAPPMALLTVGAGALLLGRDLLGLRAALDLDWVLWILGTAGGLASAVVVPYVAINRHHNDAGSAFGGWLMSVVPPMVSATTGSLLALHLPAGQLRETLIALCYSMFGLSLAASAVVIRLVWRRLLRHGIGAAAAAPTLFILLGPMGQSIAAASGLANAAPAKWSSATANFALVYGLAAWAVAVGWFCIATLITVRASRSGLPFTLSWWGLTFPVGTVVLGSSALAARTGWELFRWSSASLYVVLVLVWATVLVRTVRHAHTLLGG